MSEVHNGMQVVLMEASGRLETLWLPAGRPQGRYSFRSKPAEALCVEAHGGRWYAICGESVRFANCAPEQARCIGLTDQLVLVLRSDPGGGRDGWQAVLYAEEMTAARSAFHNYRFAAPGELRIGRAASNDIHYENTMVSGSHAVLRKDGEGWSITDNNSLNGVYVNDCRVETARLNIGDVIYIIGLRIIIGPDFLSMNCRGRAIYLNQSKLIPLDRLPAPAPPPQTEDAVFNRQPRRRAAMNLKPIVIEAPPMSMNGNKMPLVLRMGSSMVMSTSSLLAGNVAMMLSSVLFPLLSNRFTDKERKEYEERRNVSYLKYLTRKEAEIEAERRREESVLRQNYPALSRVLQFPFDGGRLWERQRTDDDFLDVRIGAGDVPLLAELNYPKEKFAMDEDPLEQKMYALAEMPVFLHDVPIQTSLTEDYVCGVSGLERDRMDFVNRLMMQLALTHSYDEVKIVLLGNEEALTTLHYVRYLPHVWNDQRTFRFLAAETTDAYQISEYLKHEVENDLEQNRRLKEILKHRPYYVIFALEKRLFDSMEFLKEVLNADENVGVSIVAAFEDLPKECSKIFQLNSTGEHSVVYLKQLDRQSDSFHLDEADPALAEKSMQQVANTSISVVTQAYALPKTYTFLEMFGVGRVEHLNIRERWRRNDPVKSLSTPVGVATDGSLFMLDLHEKYQGPHGLVAGMTGSGKSEFIITYILSMAVNYHPDEVAFILIDYKGGGLAGAFDDAQNGIRLPHLMGTITNLDGSAIQRSLLSIQSELTRRQRIFNQVKSDLGEGTMDIYTYQKLYRAQRVKEPMPHLFIISDEFAELKKQQPEFMDQLISAARIGRSLGIHLILATQRPSGVVNDQILSNTKFRVCLRVQDRSDSMDMLKRPEAAELVDTGRFYLQVGYNEFFALGQSAWCGAEYEPQDEVVVKVDESVRFLDTTGQTYLQMQQEKARTKSEIKQIVAIVRHLSELAQQEQIRTENLWKPPLPEHISLEEVEALYPAGELRGICAAVGLIDDPEMQEQFPFVLDVQNCQNLMVVGESGSGKTTFLQTLLFSLSKTYSSRDVNYYILDFSSKMMKLFQALPHCGAVLTEEQEDAIDRFFVMLREMIQERKALFEKAEVSSFEAYRSVAPMPLVLVVIDNISGLTALQKGNIYFNSLNTYLRDGVSYGIKIVLSAAHLNELSTRARQEVGTRVALHLKDKFEYGDVLNCKCTYTPPERKGRGLTVYHGRPLEYHTAQIQCEGNASEQARKLKEKLGAIARRRTGEPAAKRLTVISEEETYEMFSAKFRQGRIPLGYAIPEVKEVALPLKQFYSLSLYFGNPIGVKPVLNNFLCALRRAKARIYILRRSKDSVFPTVSEEDANVKVMECTTKSILELQNLLVDEIGARKQIRNQYAAEHGIAPDTYTPAETDSAEQRKRKEAVREELISASADYIAARTEEIVVWFESFYDFCAYSDETSAILYSAFFNGCKGYNINFIGCFYPNDAANISVPNLFRQFNPEQMLLLFGGRFDCQGLCALPTQYQSQRAVSKEYNRAVMQYRGQFYALSMPCGLLEKAEHDGEDDSIF